MKGTMNRLTAAAGLLALLACESGQSAPPTDPLSNPTPGFSLSPSKSAISTPRGWNALVDIAIARTGGFTAGVALSIEGVPPGVTANFTTPIVPALGINTRLDIDVDTAAAIGTYPLTIRATGTGVSAVSTVVTLVVPRPSFALDIHPTVDYRTSPSLGFIATINANVIRDNGFRGAVTLDASGMPAGVTVAGQLVISPNGNQGTVALLVGASTPAGSYPIVVRGTGADVEPRTATINVVIPAR